MCSWPTITRLTSLTASPIRRDCWATDPAGTVVSVMPVLPGSELGPCQLRGGSQQPPFHQIPGSLRRTARQARPPSSRARQIPASPPAAVLGGPGAGLAGAATVLPGMWWDWGDDCDGITHRGAP